MSGPMLRKVLREQEELTASYQSQLNSCSDDDSDDADSNDSTEPAHPPPPVNRFDLLDTQVESGDRGKGPKRGKGVDRGKGPKRGKGVDRGKGPKRGKGVDRGKGPVPSTTSIENDEYISDEEIFESLNPLQTITLALRKANREFLDLVAAGPTTDEDFLRIAELGVKITNYGNFVRSMRGEGEGPGDGMVARRRSLGQSPCVSLEDMESNNATNAPDAPNEPHPDPHIASSAVAEGPLHSERVDADRELRSTSAETTMRPPTIVSTAPANPAVDAHMQPQPPRRNTRSSSWREVLRTDDATLQEGPITVGDQLYYDDDLICAFLEYKKKKRKKNK